jgi:hypothetical protein
MQIDRTGVFRVKSKEHGLGQTRKAGYPQFNVLVDVTAHFDPDNGVWVDFSECDMETTVRQCMFGMVGKTGAKEIGTTLGYDQVCKVFKWDGADLQALADLPVGVEFQITVKDNDPEFADKNPYQIDWIDDYDADPTQRIAKCTPEEITGLQAKYAALLKAKAKPAAPATAKKATKKKAAPKVPAAVTEEPVVPEPPKSGVITKKKKPAVPPTPAPKPVPTKQVDNYDKNQAWGTVVSLKAENITDDQLKGAWQKSISDISNGQGEEMLNGEGWWKVKDRTLDAIGAI